MFSPLEHADSQSARDSSHLKGSDGALYPSIYRVIQTSMPVLTKRRNLGPLPMHAVNALQTPSIGPGTIFARRSESIERYGLLLGAFRDVLESVPSRLPEHIPEVPRKRSSGDG